MLLQTLIATAFASASVLAAPLQARDDPYFTPSAIWKYSVRNGAISETTNGEISKYNSNGGNDITTLLTFTYPKAAEGKQCQFAFYLDSTAIVSGSKKLDVFTSNNPAPGPTTGWGPGNQRNINLGRLSVTVPGTATWDDVNNAYLTAKTPCKAEHTVEGFELVGVYDNDYVSWNPDLSGPRIIYT
ncbi:hypothetical protein EDB81DRAFT_803008 [Dactylonectria macrodidyma]|uniref:Ubiquitin 3 binding protein But2 C-terminal domain-containing protein n=1 Tax=Dactylonectria macrodidyma TaxID=307937 RepID=A0A9P9IWZ1_9HYPO|nr:hypothetical protein EDB81DRAFT_803008 [Dactylonectria macrodidyma]